jgi:hypothetical protein
METALAPTNGKVAATIDVALKIWRYDSRTGEREL